MRAPFRRSICALTTAAFLAQPLSVLAAPSRFGLQNPEAIQHAEAAAAAGEREDYETAIRELKTAYAIEPRPIVLYAWAQAERLGGHCNRAVRLYQDFLDTKPGGDIENQARVNLLDCQAEVGTTPPAPDVEGDDEPDDDTSGDDAPADDDTTDEGDEESPLKGEWLAPTLLGVGAATAIAGGVVLALGRGRVTNSVDAPTELAYDDEVESGQTMFVAGAAVMGVGGALLIGGAIRYILVARQGPSKQSKTPNASAMVTRTGFGLSLSGRF
ncbi:MAG: hypothetical protein AAGA54_02535 [Myxococcota bacterium]